jgi:hypothetical protein
LSWQRTVSREMRRSSAITSTVCPSVMAIHRIPGFGAEKESRAALTGKGERRQSTAWVQGCRRPC